MIDEKIVMRDSDEAAQLKTVTGWVSRNGQFYGDDERTARWAGCTHEVCDGCGKVIQRGWCKGCREKKDVEKWLAAERAEYDGVAMLYSDSSDKYFSDEVEAEEYAEDNGISMDDLRLYICNPVYGRPIDSGHFCDELPEDGEVPDSIGFAMDALNKAIKDAGPLSWYPGKKVPILTPKAVQP
jgi:hypothetical protein